MQQKLNNLTKSYLMQMLQVLFPEWKYISIKSNGIIKLRNTYLNYPWTSNYQVKIKDLISKFEQLYGKAFYNKEAYLIDLDIDSKIIYYYRFHFQKIKFTNNLKVDDLGDKINNLLIRRRVKKLSNNIDDIIISLKK